MSVTTDPVPQTKGNGHSTLSPSITSALNALRSKIRMYVWVQGLALVIAWLGLSFWISLAIDWLPVPFGNDEPGVPVRVGVLIATGVVVMFILVRYVLRRSVVPLRDRNMAVLLERRFREFDDSLLTAVELTAEPEHASGFNPDMLEETCKIAVDKTGKVQVSEVLNPGPRMLAVVMAIVLVGSVAAFAVAASDSFNTWFNRAVLLSDDLWPRTNHIKIEGPRVLKVARGEDVTIRVIATSEGEKELPSNVRMEYINEDGVESSTNLDRRAPKNGTQEFSHTIYGMLSSIKFDVIGGDHRIRDYEIHVVDRPSVQLTLHCEYPEYMRNPATGEFPFPPEIPVTRTVEIPRGTRISVKAEANKPLQQARLHVSDTDSGSEGAVVPLDDPENFSLEIPALETDRFIQLSLLDTDGISSKEPTRLMIVAMPDEPPTVDARLRGIGTAITPDVVIPLVGELRDRYGLDRAFWDIVVLQGEDTRADAQVDLSNFRRGRSVQTYALITEDGELQESLDIRRLRREEIRRRNEEARPNPGSPDGGTNDVDDGTVDDGNANSVGNAGDGEMAAGMSAPFLFADSLSANDVTFQADQQNETGGLASDQSQQPDDLQPSVDPSNPYQLVPGEMLQLTIVVADACTLDGQPNIGRSQVFRLEVVTPQRLRSILAGRELALRKRFEDQLIVEFDGSIDLISGLNFKAIEAAPETIDSSKDAQLLNIHNLPGDRFATKRLQGEWMAGDAGTLPILAMLSSTWSQPLAVIALGSWRQQPGLEPGERPRQLRQKTRGELMLQAEADVREVILRSQKNANEIVGIAEGFEDILLEFTNNRVPDSQELTSRIQENIATPLREIGETMFPLLDQRLLVLQENLNSPATREKAVLEAQQYMLEVDDAMQTVLSHMLQLESYEELVEKMREIIEIQERINRETGTYRRQQIFGGGNDGGGQ
ncbi:MAG: hypothetical protein MPJ50_16650 [Pirellulales bacterium]|nr:hypothetical protein [Pirellulales bacterium]